MRIFGWAADNAGCGWYRLRSPLDTLASQGLAETLVSEIWDEPFCRTADVIVGQRVSNPGASKRWTNILSLPRDERPFMVYEIDDDLLSVSADNDIASDYYNKPERREIIMRNMLAADMITVSTERLAEAVRGYAPGVPVAVLGNYIPRALLDRPLGAVSRTGQPITVGWAGSATHGGDFALINASLRRVWDRTVMPIEYHIMGTDYLPRSLHNDGAVRFTPWVDGVGAYYDLIDFNIGLAPLKAGMFNRSKSYIKALEYAALGIPTIASDAGPYPDFVENGENGLLIRQDFQWVNAIMRLVNDSDQREHMGEIARRDARRYTVEEHARKWLLTYERGIRDALQFR